MSKKNGQEKEKEEAKANQWRRREQSYRMKIAINRIKDDAAMPSKRRISIESMPIWD
jgi:hypothetical protein